MQFDGSFRHGEYLSNRIIAVPPQNKLHDSPLLVSKAILAKRSEGRLHEVVQTKLTVIRARVAPVRAHRFANEGLDLLQSFHLVG